MSKARLAVKKWSSQQTVVGVRDLFFGGQDLVVIAGPCAVETQEQMDTIGTGVRTAGAQALRGGAYKPRTSPYDFQGLAEEGLKMLARAGKRSRLPIVTEVVAPEHVPLVSRYADMLQIGTRNMSNFELLKAVGRSKRPCLLKRGMSATLEELLMAAEYIMAHGNPRVVLCERGIRTFETYTRNTLDLSAVPALKELTHLPVVVDPSHGTGRRALVEPMALAAVACGADGLIIEVHHDPEQSWTSDGQQSLDLDAFQRLMSRAKALWQTMQQVNPRPRSNQRPSRLPALPETIGNAVRVLN
ncbi:MAG: 3-deoxy-7-phosphoheptulonate synthase [Limnochordia bacterium]